MVIASQPALTEATQSVRQATPAPHDRYHRKMMRAIGLFLSLLGTWCQILLLAAVSLAPLKAVGDPVAGLPICHAGADDATGPGRQAPVRHTHDCALCSLCLTHAFPLAIVPPTPSLPSRRSVEQVRLSPAYQRAPPVRPVAAFRPRGPPVLI